MAPKPPEDGNGPSKAEQGSDPPHPDGLGGSNDAAPARRDEPKQVIVMRTDLKMRKGKMIAQGAHASGKVFFDRIPEDVRNIGMPEGLERMRVPMEIDRAMAEWLFDVAFAKICVRVGSEEELLDIYEKALGAGLPCALITDAGRTEFHGVPTKTCCAIGPAMPKDVDPITGHLDLL